MLLGLLMALTLYNFIYLCIAVLGLPCCVSLSLAVESGGYSPAVGPLIVVAFLVALCTWDFSSCSMQAQGL